MKLEEGPITLRELSLWFGLKPDTIRNSRPETKAKKFEKLKNFADFHFEGKKLIIDKVIIPEYSKAYDVIDRKFEDEWGLVIDKTTHQVNWQKEARVDTCSRVGRSLYQKYPEVKQVKEKTAISYVGQVRKERYGRVYSQEKGNMGQCQLVYINQENTGLLSNEEYEILRKCREEAYKTVGEKIAELDDAYRAGELTKEEKDLELQHINTDEEYIKYQELLVENLGFIPEKRTQLIGEESALYTNFSTNK